MEEVMPVLCHRDANTYRYCVRDGVLRKFTVAAKHLGVEGEIAMKRCFLLFLATKVTFNPPPMVRKVFRKRLGSAYAFHRAMGITMIHYGKNGFHFETDEEMSKLERATSHASVETLVPRTGCLAPVERGKAGFFGAAVRIEVPSRGRLVRDVRIRERSTT